MTNASFASLHAGLLARKGEARPSAEAMLANVLRRPVTAPTEAPQSFMAAKPGAVTAAQIAVPRQVQVESARTDLKPGYTKLGIQEFGDQVSGIQEPGERPDYEIRVREALAAWPAPKPDPALDHASWVPESTFRQPTPARATLRLTQLQARALKLASLVLDRPQQELLQAGLASQLDALACTDLANCACFKAAIAGLPNS